MASASPSASKRKREVEENAFQEFGPPPPSPLGQSHPRYDVFINHRGPDVKNTLASVLYRTLQFSGLRCFWDSPDFQLGDSLPTTIQQAICSSQVHIAIFSKRYAESRWCLEELRLMLETRAKIVPLFYGVKPHDLRNCEKGSYSDAFTKYREKGRDMDKLEQWEQALRQASFLTGIEFDPSYGNLGNLCKTTADIVLDTVRETRNKFKLEVAVYPVGLEEAIEELEANISAIGQSKTGNGELVGIVGLPGVGKTTLAKELYNRTHSTFSRSSFLCDVGEAYRNGKIMEMQRKLMCDLDVPMPLFPPIFQPTSPKEGFGVDIIKSQLERWYSKPLLIICDGVDHEDQLEALALNELLNHGTLVVVTTRDASVLQSFEMLKLYKMRGLDLKHGRELLCWHAFRRSHPPHGWEKLVEDILKVSGGLPLHLKNLGQDIYSLQSNHDAVKF